MTDYGNAGTACTRASDAEMHKPPIGVKPGWLHAAQRISELADAIHRHIYDEHVGVNIPLMRMWAEEMILQLEILDKLTESGEDGE